MSTKGFIYVLTNRALPGLVKIGFSHKDPILRASELNSTGLPHNFEVEYQALIDDPRQIEQNIHKQLMVHHEAKEFFRISIADAIASIKYVIDTSGRTIYFEDFAADRRAAALQRLQEERQRHEEAERIRVETERSRCARLALIEQVKAGFRDKEVAAFKIMDKYSREFRAGWIETFSLGLAKADPYAAVPALA